MEKLVEWELTLKCNYKCSYCGLLDNSLVTVTNKEVLRKFINDINRDYKDIEIFLFGGEPFLHPEIEFIINTFLELKQPFVVQTNLSDFSVKKILSINKIFNINVSVHLEHCTEEQILNNLNIIKNIVNIKNVDIMFSNIRAFNYYKSLKEFIPILAPISNMGVSGFSDILEQYNSFKNNKVFRNLYTFENIERDIGDGKKQRSLIWQEFNDGKKTLGNDCLYVDSYVLFGPDLKKYNCCYRKNHNGICKNEYCFLM
jgi:MoaA/NifB/PqqE/SkfB family radical SAM enzyme